MRNITLAIAAVALVSAGSLIQNRAEATTLGASAGMRAAVEVAGPVEEVRHRRRHFRRHFVHFRFHAYPRHRAYAYHPYPYRRSYYRSWGHY